MQPENEIQPIKEKPKKTRVDYNKWGYYFLIPFIVVYFAFSLIPLLSTFYYSFFEYRQQGLSVIGPNFIGFQNYSTVFIQGSDKLFKYFGNTMIIWIMGFIPQIVISLLFALWFTSSRLRIKASSFYKTIMYMPNLVMAAAFSMLFLQLFANNGPIETLIINAGWASETFTFAGKVWSTRSIIAFINFLMWFGNTTILLMAGIMGIDQTVMESAQVDGASSSKVFFKIILPLLRPILLFVLVTSLIGGVQMFDVPYIYSQGDGGPNFSTMTIMMYISKLLGPSKQLGLASAVSVVVFIITGAISFIFFRFLGTDNEKPVRQKTNTLLKIKFKKFINKIDFIDKYRAMLFEKNKKKYENRSIAKKTPSLRIIDKLVIVVQRFSVYFIFSIFTLLIIFIFYILILNATKSHVEIQRGFNVLSNLTFQENTIRFFKSLLPQSNFLINLSNLFANQNLNVGRALFNSLFISLASAALTTYFSAMTAYAIHLYRFKGRKFIYTFILSVMMIPAQIASAGLIVILYKYNLLDNYWVLIIPGIAAPATFFFMKQYMDSILPFEVIESARVDGANELKIFHRLVLPMVSPAIAVQFIFSFVAAWNNFYLPNLIITSPDKKTIPMVISLLTSSSPDTFDLGPVYMLMVIAIIPMVIIYLILSKKIIKGVTLGSVKG
ncbi:MAG: ABC transporter permease subunit [Acholeplasmataceae bacterium]